MKCANCFNCSGKMVIRCRHEKRGQVWVAAHELPVFAQCDGCGHAPLPDEQPAAVAALLQEFLQNGNYVREMTHG